MDLPDRTVERLSVYRRLLNRLIQQGRDRVFSHELAAEEGLTAAQVRRDLMTIGFTGSPAKGYDTAGLLETIEGILSPAEGQGIALVGVGHLGQAILSHFDGRRSHLAIVAAFDVDPGLAGRLVHGTHCYPVADLGRIVRERGIEVGIVAVPADAAQEIADVLVAAGVTGLQNFAPVRLRVPDDIYVHNVYLTVSLEKVAYFARQAVTRREGHS